jgi:hypothetical protein
MWALPQVECWPSLFLVCIRPLQFIWEEEACPHLQVRIGVIEHMEFISYIFKNVLRAPSYYVSEFSKILKLWALLNVIGKSRKFMLEPTFARFNFWPFSTTFLAIFDHLHYSTSFNHFFFKFNRSVFSDCSECTKFKDQVVRRGCSEVTHLLFLSFSNYPKFYSMTNSIPANPATLPGFESNFYLQVSLLPHLSLKVSRSHLSSSLNSVPDETLCMNLR